MSTDQGLSLVERQGSRPAAARLSAEMPSRV